MDRQPNILFILNDHQAYYRHGWDGGVRPRIPHFDGLAAEGMRFNRAYCPTALCVPARRSILTGLYPHNHGLITNDETLPERDSRLFFRPLREKGYTCHYYGKWHNGPMHLWRDGCEGFSMPSYGNPYQTPIYQRYCEALGLPEARCFIERDLDRAGPIEEEMALGDINFYSDKSSGLLLTPKESHEAYFLAHLAKETLTELKDRRDPWFMMVSFWGPHRPYFPSEEFANRYRPEDIREYGSFHLDLDGKPESHSFEHNPMLHDGSGNMVQPSALPWSEWQMQLARCYAHITMVDAAGGSLLAALDETGLTDDTVVIWTTDHGDAIASHGGHGTKGPPMTEEIYRIPLAIRWPGTVEGGGGTEALVSLIDMAPTLLDITGAQPEIGSRFGRPADGKSLLPVLKNQASGVREDLVCEFNGLGGHIHSRFSRPIYHARSLTTERYKYVATLNDREELYDLSEDPYQLHNLNRNGGYRDLLKQMRRRLVQWQHETCDTQPVLSIGE